MKSICVQLDIVWENKQANFDRVRALLEEAKVEPGSLIVLPEMFATGFSMDVQNICEDESAETETFLAAVAKQYRSYILGGLVRQAPDGLGRNEAVVFDPSGHEHARYCKLHPFSYAGETNHYASGECLVTFEWHDFTVAPFICYDLRFPEVFRHAAERKADLFTVIACWPQPREVHWVVLLKARAIENQAYVVAVNRCGKDPTLAYSGRSMIVDPRGNVMADAGTSEGTICAELDHQLLENYRSDFPALADIRPEYRRRG